jgi:hypothetical protein
MTIAGSNTKGARLEVVADIKLGSDGKARLSVVSGQMCFETILSYHEVCGLSARLSSVRAHMEEQSVPSLVKEKQQQASAMSSREVIEMVYVGLDTEIYINAVRRGTKTLATLKRELRIWADAPGDPTLSRHEAISLLERGERVQKTPTELANDRASYQKSIECIEREPDAYVAPDIARSWYEQQIERIQHLLQQGTDLDLSSHSAPGTREVEVQR